MKIYEGHNEIGELVYFEIPNIFLQRRNAINIIKSLPDVRVIKENLSNDIFLEFMVNDKAFEIMEPFGDNSRYHIGEKKVRFSKELILIKEMFATHKNIILRILNRYRDRNGHH
jgi:hypothetical protein